MIVEITVTLLVFAALRAAWMAGRVSGQGSVHPYSPVDAELVDSVDYRFDEFEPHVAHPTVPDAPDAPVTQIKCCLTCGAERRRRLNGKPYCYECKSMPWLWE